MSAVVYAVGSLICHQRPERSFAIGGVALPVCARCTGLYLGAALGACGVVASPRGRVLRPQAVMAAAVAPLVLSLAIEWAGLADPGNRLRALSGVIAGAGVAAVVLTLHYAECARTRRNEPQRPPTPI